MGGPLPPGIHGRPLRALMEPDSAARLRTGGDERPREGMMEIGYFASKTTQSSNLPREVSFTSSLPSVRLGEEDGM
jgi:hypothetical protein